MDFIKIILATLVGTTLMTLFSYLVSNFFNKLYKEPVLLNYLLHYLGINMRDRAKRISGWVIHYIIGLIFVIVYDILWQYKIQFSWLSGIIFGMISGIVGIISWIFMFKVPDDKPKIDYKGYYIQLLFAHIIFAIGVVIVYKIY